MYKIVKNVRKWMSTQYCKFQIEFKIISLSDRYSAICHGLYRLPCNDKIWKKQPTNPVIYVVNSDMLSSNAKSAHYKSLDEKASILQKVVGHMMVFSRFDLYTARCLYHVCFNCLVNKDSQNEKVVRLLLCQPDRLCRVWLFSSSSASNIREVQSTSLHSVRLKR